MDSLRNQHSLMYSLHVEQDDGEENTCVVCCDAIEFYGLGKCNHRETCALCSLRRRVLYGDNKCPICMVRHTNEILISIFPKIPHRYTM